jgi:hypothetical protein
MSTTTSHQQIKLLTTNEVAAWLGRTPAALRQLAHGNSPAARHLLNARVRIGRHVRYRSDRLCDLLDHCG